MPALSRITTPLKALLPDLTDVPQSRQTVGAIVASLVAHLLLFLFFMAASGFLPETKVEFHKNVAPQPLEVVIQLPDSPAEVMTPEELKARAERETIDSTGLAKSDEKVKDPLFESDQDMKAAAQAIATGDAPLPSQEGKSLPFQNFTTQDVVLGSPSNPPAAPAPPVRPPKPEPRASVQPKPLAEETPEPPPPPEEEQKKPEKMPEVLKPDDSQIAIASKVTEPITRVEKAKEKKATPEPVKEPKKEPMEMAKLVTPPQPQDEPLPEVKPRPPSEAGFQPQQEKTKIEGSISNRGPAAVDAVRTPLAVYRKQVNAAIGSRWYYYVKQRRDVIALGQAKVSYSITKDGRIVSIKVVENTSNQAFALICEQSVSEAEIGPPPDEALAVMVNGRLEGDLTFTYYSGF